MLGRVGFLGCGTIVSSVVAGLCGLPVATRSKLARWPLVISPRNAANSAGTCSLSCDGGTAAPLTARSTQGAVSRPRDRGHRQPGGAGRERLRGAWIDSAGRSARADRPLVRGGRGGVVRVFATAQGGQLDARRVSAGGRGAAAGAGRSCSRKTTVSFSTVYDNRAHHARRFTCESTCMMPVTHHATPPAALVRSLGY